MPTITPSTLFTAAANPPQASQAASLSATPGSSARPLSETQIQGAAYRMMRAFAGRPERSSSTHERMERLNISMEKTREKITPGLIQTELDRTANEAFYRMSATRLVSRHFGVHKDDYLENAIVDRSASDVVRGGSCGEITAQETTGTELREGESMLHLYDPARQRTRYRPDAARPEHHYAVLQAGENPDPQRDVLGDGFSRHGAMVVEDTSVDPQRSMELYRVSAAQLPEIQERVRAVTEEINILVPEPEELVSELRGRGVPPGRAPFPARPSVIDPVLAGQARGPILALPQEEQEKQAVFFAMQEVPGLSREDAGQYSARIIAAATIGS